jgi:hypothetical protein
MKQTTFIAVTALVAGLGAGAAAQDPQEMARRAEIERMAATQTMARTAVEARFTTGAPYAAEAVTESTQQLADGNRIVKKNITRIFRDNEGRTRREQLAANGVDVQTVNISDPVAESTFVLFPETRTAFRNGVVIATPRGVATASVGPGATGVVTATRSPVPSPGAAGPALAEASPPAAVGGEARALAGCCRPNSLDPVIRASARISVSRRSKASWQLALASRRPFPRARLGTSSRSSSYPNSGSRRTCRCWCSRSTAILAPGIRFTG